MIAVSKAAEPSAAAKSSGRFVTVEACAGKRALIHRAECRESKQPFIYITRFPHHCQLRAALFGLGMSDPARDEIFRLLSVMMLPGSCVRVDNKTLTVSRLSYPAAEQAARWLVGFFADGRNRIETEARPFARWEARKWPDGALRIRLKGITRAASISITSVNPLRKAS